MLLFILQINMILMRLDQDFHWDLLQIMEALFFK